VGLENFANRWHSYALLKKLAIPWRFGCGSACCMNLKY